MILLGLAGESGKLKHVNTAFTTKLISTFLPYFLCHLMQSHVFLGSCESPCEADCTDTSVSFSIADKL